MCCAHGPSSSLKATVPPISLTSSLWRLLKVKLMIPGSKSSRLSHRKYEKGLGMRLDGLLLKTTNDSAIYLARCFAFLYMFLHETVWVCVCTPHMAHAYSMHVVMPKTKLFYDHIFQKSLRMCIQCVPGPSLCTRGPGDEASTWPRS